MQDSGFKKKDRLTTNIPQEQFVYTRGGEHKVMKKRRVVNSVLLLLLLASALALTVAPMAFADRSMKKRKVLIPLMALSTILVSSTGNLEVIQAEVKQENRLLNESESSSQGLLGYYFSDLNFQAPMVVTSSTTGDLSIPSSELENIPSENQYFQSAIWSGFIKVKKSDEYTFATSADNHVTMWVDDQEVINKASNSNKIRLEKGRLYQIKIQYQRENPTEKGLDFKLYWTDSQNKKEVISSDNLQLPELKQKSSNSRKKRSTSAGPTVPDRDNDGIPDSLEVEGYTVDVKNKRTFLSPWISNIHEKKGLTKYKSSPEKWSTASDPYSDFEKVTGRIDKNVSPEARHPLVAA